jgi:hypothetical protein
MENKELVEKLNELNITQHSIDWTENLPDEVWEDHFVDKFKEVENGLDIDTRRWYETSVTVLKINGGYIGIHRISNTFSESMMVEDCYHTLRFEEMREIQITSYESI